MKRSKWQDVSVITLMMFINSLMYTLKTYQVLGREMVDTTNGIVFTIGTVIFAIATIIFFIMSLKQRKT